MKYQAVSTQRVSEKGIVVIDVEIWHDSDIPENRQKALDELMSEIERVISNHSIRSLQSIDGYGFNIPRINKDAS